MKLTESQLRQIIRETLDTITVMMPGPNYPWGAKIPKEVSRQKAEKIADIAMSVAKENYGKFKNSYQYDTPIFSAIAHLMPAEQNEIYALLLAVEQVLKERGGEYRDDWHDPAYAAHRTIKTRVAYSTPRFREAQHNSMMRGS